MLSEILITSIHAQQRTANTAIAKDVGIYLHTLHPNLCVTGTFKKSSTRVNALAATATHIFAAQVDKAVVHVYSWERGNQEALISFPERIHSLVLVADGVLALGTAEGRLILWETLTGRQVSTPATHLQSISCIAATPHHLITGSEDSNIHVWSIPQLLSLSQPPSHEPCQILSDHRAGISALATGHSSSSTNICVSASKDNTINVWNYATGSLLRTYLLPSTPLCLVLDPCDRAAFTGMQDGSLQVIEFLQPSASIINPLHDPSLQATPVQITLPSWTTPTDFGPVNCLALGYDGATLYSGHASGKVAQWDVGRRAFSSEMTDLNAPVTNLILTSPFGHPARLKPSTISKPKVGEANYVLNAQLIGSVGDSTFENRLLRPGIPVQVLEDAISRFSYPATTAASSSIPDEQAKLKKENEELWKVIAEQRELQKKTFEQLSKLKTKAGGA